MAVRLKFANDLNIFGGSRGAGGFLSTPVLIGGGYPAYGTVLSTAYGVDYEIGAEIFSPMASAYFFTQICNVNTLADGVGGTFVDWANAGNVQYKANGTHIAYGDAISFNPVEVPTDSGNYNNNTESDSSEETHNGTGGSSITPIGGHYWPVTTLIYGHSVNQQDGVPETSSNYFDNGLTDNYEYRWDGNGGYIHFWVNTTGSLYADGTEVAEGLRYTTSNTQTEVPTSSNSYYDNGQHNEDTYYWNGSGNTYTGALASNPIGSFYADGTFIASNGSTPNYTAVPTENGSNFENGTGNNHDWLWNGSGGYRNEDTPYGSYYGDGTEVDANVFRCNFINNQAEIPVGCDPPALYDNGLYSFDTVTWDGNGGYQSSNFSEQGNPFPFGTFITQNNCFACGVDGSLYGLAYFWDGSYGSYINTYP